MRKQTKLVAVLSATALLAVGASMTSYADWNSLGNGDWEYLDKDGDRVTNEWRRSSAGFCFLDEDGLMARNRIVTPDESGDDNDDYYYVNDTGERRKNAWARVENVDDEEVNDQEVSVLYYYLGANGKAYKATDSTKGKFKKATINWMGKNRTFFFDENARMVSGWVQSEDSPDNNEYYCGDEIEGYAYTGWWVLDVPEYKDDDKYESSELFCFDDAGKLRKGTVGSPKVWYNNGWYYTFDENGVCQDDWYKVDLATENNIVATPNTVSAYTTSMGIEKKAGWVYADIDDNGDSYWYYLVAVEQPGNKVARNVPFNSLGNDTLQRALVVGKKTYLFDANGKMLEGLQEIKAKNTKLTSDKLGGKISKAMTEGTYYFSKDSATKGQMLVGRQTVTDNDETYEYYFAKDGQAEKNKIINDIFYGPDGKRIQAEDGNKYMIYTVGDPTDKVDDTIHYKNNKDLLIPEGSEIVINARGKVVKASATSKDKAKSVKIDDSYYDVWIDKDNGGIWRCDYNYKKNNK